MKVLVLMLLVVVGFILPMYLINTSARFAVTINAHKGGEGGEPCARVTT